MRLKRDWESRALCLGMAPEDLDNFFPEDDNQPTPSYVKEVCRQCSTRIDCLAYSVVYGEVGIWAGMTEKERDISFPPVVRQAMIDNARAHRWDKERPLPLAVYNETILDISIPGPRQATSLTL